MIYGTLVAMKKSLMSTNKNTGEKMFKKVICLTIAIAFFINSACYGLSVQPGTIQEGTRDGMYAMAGDLYIRDMSPAKQRLLEMFWLVGNKLALGQATNECRSMGIGNFKTENKDYPAKSQW